MCVVIFVFPSRSNIILSAHYKIVRFVLDPLDDCVYQLRSIPDL